MNPYKVLGVPKNASQIEIKYRWKQLCSLYHPDRETGDKAKMQEVNAAYEILSDKERRAAYDATGSTQPISSDTVESKIQSCLAEFFSVAIDQDLYDIPKSVRESMINVLGVHKNQLRTTIHRIARLKLKRGKVVRKDDKPNMVEEILSGRLMTLEETKKRTEEIIEVFTGALQEVENYANRTEETTNAEYEELNPKIISNSHSF